MQLCSNCHRNPEEVNKYHNFSGNYIDCLCPIEPSSRWPRWSTILSPSSAFHICHTAVKWLQLWQSRHPRLWDEWKWMIWRSHSRFTDKRFATYGLRISNSMLSSLIDQEPNYWEFKARMRVARCLLEQIDCSAMWLTLTVKWNSMTNYNNVFSLTVSRYSSCSNRIRKSNDWNNLDWSFVSKITCCKFSRFGRFCLHDAQLESISK